ncbi:hypothetical protein BKA62DRAFT_767298 [Auriculariales sp. MPI-PUGE-AT-0066]|nr:hypothetical protein BKA62DRAFT_767298 [Auriculariales sp. MPI-PUGE-AT-0066]
MFVPVVIAVLPLLARASAQFTESELQAFLINTSATIFPPLKTLSQAIWSRPELSLSEVFASGLIADHFETEGGWTVTRGAYGLPTALEITWKSSTPPSAVSVPVIGILAEYDALAFPGLTGLHACGHNLIALNGIATASLIRKAAEHYNIPVEIRLLGTPDEEFTGGKIRMSRVGAFTRGDVWLMAHPTTVNAIQPMGARHDVVLSFEGTNHFETIAKAYKALVGVDDLAGKLPGTASVATPTENTGTFEMNVVQTNILFGVVGDATVVENAMIQAKATRTAFSGVSWTTTTDNTGVVLNITGPGGHAAEGTFGALALSAETFRILSLSQPTYQYFLPHNTTVTQLDLTISTRSRYTADMSSVEAAVLAAVQPYFTKASWDTIFLALEVSPYLGGRISSIYSEFGINFPISSNAPAATDAAWLQQPVVDPSTHALLSEKVPVLHANYGICPNTTGCPFNHEAGFAALAGTDFAYGETERMSRVEAQIALELLTDPVKMAAARALVR